MKVNIASILLCVILGLAVVLGGCGKKEDKAKEPPKQGGSTAKNLSDVVKESADKATETGGKMIESAREKAVVVKEKAVEVKEKAVAKMNTIVQQYEADKGKSIEEVAADAKEMAVERVRKMAEQYRDAIASSQQTLRDLTEKFVALTDAEKNGPQGQIFKTLIDQVHGSITLMKERFQVYFDQLKELSGDVTGLE